MDWTTIFGRWKCAFLILLLAVVLLAAASPVSSASMVLIGLAFVPILLWILHSQPTAIPAVDPDEAHVESGWVRAQLFQRPPPFTL